ncbi:transposase [Bacteroidia bacterium]|nr:transposase [Bacteroidia bacterium]
MAKYLDPKNDLVFKRVFGEHPHLLISFLNALMPLEKGNEIESIEYLSPELVPENPLKKRSIVDVRCKDKQGRFFIVEMQMEWSSAFMQRMLLNASKVFGTQLDKGKDFNLLQPVYALAILNDDFDHKTKNFYHRFQFLNKDNTNEVIDGIELIFVELQKFKPEKLTDKKMAILWLRFLKEVNEKNAVISSELMDNPDIHTAIDICEKAGFTEAELQSYDEYWDQISYEVSIVSEGYRKGEAKGKAEGKAEGLNEGVDIGEWNKAVKVILKGNKAGMSVDALAALTELSPEQVTAILKEQGLLNS